MQEFNQEEFDRQWAADYCPERTLKDYLRDIAKAVANVPTPDFEFLMQVVGMGFLYTVIMFFYCVFGGY